MEISIEKVQMIREGANPYAIFFGDSKEKDKCSDPWACRNWLCHAVCPHGCEAIRISRLSKSNIGFDTHEEAVEHVKKYILTWCVAVWAHPGDGSMGIDSIIYYGCTANPWLIDLVKTLLRSCLIAYLQTMRSSNEYWNESVRHILCNKSIIVQLTFCRPRWEMMST